MQSILLQGFLLSGALEMPDKAGEAALKPMSVGPRTTAPLAQPIAHGAMRDRQDEYLTGTWTFPADVAHENRLSAPCELSPDGDPGRSAPLPMSYRSVTHLCNVVASDDVYQILRSWKAKAPALGASLAPSAF